jgi:NADH-quinone oxidoreductase subunit C
MNPDAVKEKLASRFGPDTIEVEMFRDQVIVNVPCQKIVNICQFLRDDPEMKFDFLSFVGGVDRMPESPRFELVYQLYSTGSSERLRIKTRATQDEDGAASIDSVYCVWPSADWHERETAEMFGIVFNNHPDPRNLLLPDEWTIHPLRKDFPLMGSDQDTPDLSK